MKTTTGQAILNAAAELAQRTRDKIPAKEQILLQGYIAEAFGDLLSEQIWPELVPDFVNVQNIANNQFSKNEGDAGEIGDILAILDQNPHTTEFWRPISFSVGDNVVYLHEGVTSVWVEYMLPYPGVTFPDMDPQVMTLANFFAAKIPDRFRKILAHRAAAQLLGSDGNAAAAGVQFGLADAALAKQINRLADIPTPAWRGMRVESGGRHKQFGTPAVC